VQVEADKDATISDLQAQIRGAGMHISGPSTTSASLQEQASNRRTRDEQMSAALQRTHAQAQQLEALCARAERSSAEKVC
jgi:hypothetical protein